MYLSTIWSEQIIINIWLQLLEEQGLQALMGGAEMIDKEPPPVSAPEEKRPTLSLEELEAKQGNIITKENRLILSLEIF